MHLMHAKMRMEIGFYIVVHIDVVVVVIAGVIVDIVVALVVIDL